MRKIAQQAVRKVSKSRLGNKIAKKAAQRKGLLKSRKSVLTKRNKLSKMDWIENNLDFLSPEELEGWLSYLDKFEKLLVLKRRIGKVKEVLHIYNMIIDPKSALTSYFDRKVIWLLFGKKKDIKWSDCGDFFNDPKEMRKFEKRLDKFSQNPDDIQKFNKMMDKDGNGINVALGLNSSWLYYGIYIPVKGVKNFGNVILKLNPAKCYSSKNPSLIYNYGIGFKDPPMHYSVWKQMVDKPHAGTTYWRKYKHVFSKFKTRKTYYESYKKNKRDIYANRKKKGK